MNIKSINNNVHLPNKIENSSKKEIPESAGKTDQASISDEAKQLSKSGIKDLDIEAYKSKVLNKFYDSDTVIRKVSSEVLKDIKRS